MDFMWGIDEQNRNVLKRALCMERKNRNFQKLSILKG